MAKILPNGQIQVQSGDTLYAIAQQVLGDGSRWKELGFNGDPKQLKVGTVLSPSSSSSGSTSKLHDLIYQSSGGTKPNPSPTATPAAKSTSANATPTNPVDDFLQQTLDTYTKPFLEAQSRAKEFDEKNPFSFDEALARQSSLERLDPYYKAQLTDYTTGVERSKGRTEQDTKNLIEQLSQSSTRQKSQNEIETDRAIRNSENGYASNDTFLSGDRVANTGEKSVDSNNVTTGIDNATTQGINSANINRARSLEDLKSGQDTFNRNIKAAKETSIQTDTSQQKADAQKAYELNRQQYIGFPYVSGGSSVNSFVGS